MHEKAVDDIISTVDEIIKYDKSGKTPLTQAHTTVVLCKRSF